MPEPFRVGPPAPDPTPDTNAVPLVPIVKPVAVAMLLVSAESPDPAASSTSPPVEVSEPDRL